MSERPLVSKTYPLKEKVEGRSQEIRKVLEQAIRELPDEKLNQSGVLFASFRGGQITLVV